MLSELRVESFKCFASLALPLRPMTLLSGTNGGGKSSVIQALVLLTHTLTKHEWSTALLLDDPELSLGTAADVLNQRSATRQLCLGATAGSDRVDWTFSAQDRRALSLKLSSVTVGEARMPLSPPLRWLLPQAVAEKSDVVRALRRTTWITAERTGPRELLPLRDPSSHRRVGSRGELAAGLLYWQGDDPVRPVLLVQDQPPTLHQQVRARMKQFFPGCDLRVSAIDGASAVSLQLRSDQRSEFQRPQNVGFGLTQLFPILVALLSADEGDLLLIENPEVHLHPKAQQAIGYLLGVAASSGVQVILETHSDHVLNGVRVAVKRGQLSPGDTAVHFFAPDPDSGPAAPRSPLLNADGKLSEWPEGFFDQFDAALAELL